MNDFETVPYHLMKKVVKTEDYNEANLFLKLGWILLDVTNGEYSLGWHQDDDPDWPRVKGLDFYLPDEEEIKDDAVETTTKEKNDSEIAAMKLLADAKLYPK